METLTDSQKDRFEEIAEEKGHNPEWICHEGSDGEHVRCSICGSIIWKSNSDEPIQFDCPGKWNSTKA